MSRSVPEWIGKTADSHIPPRVRLRVFYRDSGICQCGCTRLIRAGERWQTDHIVAFINGGANRESNLRTLLAKHHAQKTKTDVAEKANVYRKRASHLGLMPAKQKIKSPGFAKRVRTHAGRPPVVRRNSSVLGN